MKAFTIVVAAALLLGCKPADMNSSGGGEQQQRNDVVDTMTQKNKVDAGVRAANQIRDITSDQQDQLDEVMGK